ncbi:sulfotransferase family protein [Thiorhodovibrio frisius]|uniref:Uncharacterized protein n=1 Tax=Thiorhodovibrio frisius TaxID=631362 RepID=H8Z257_9GAMM|nr:hypothetical protein [Thiorhodovibrio frisius]EIC22619.1 hypothetical protein Thi970DRAFT_02896 [Thiorhodovibrio frisius]WPL20062.1 hypothetical protein Thiofri_00116 [Thiorhodovibrio frisius]
MLSEVDPLSPFVPGHFHFSDSIPDRPTLHDIVQRVHAFLDAYPDCPLIRYEDFVAEPAAVMPRICEALALGYNPDFTDTFAVIELSDNTGRSGDLISPRPRRPHLPALEQEARDSEPFMSLLTRLDYRLKDP